MTKIAEIIKKTKFKDIELPHVEPLITINGKTCLTEGNFITISGLPKSRKTTFMQLFIGSALTLKDQIGIYCQLHQDEKIVLFDTEQSIYDFARQTKYLKNLIEAEKLPKNFSAFLLREYEPELQMQTIMRICETEKPKILFIDNITDLAFNINDPFESKKIVQFLKLITAKFNCGVVCLLHVNKKDGNTAGHLGSITDRSAQAILKVTLHKESNTSTLEPIMMRSDGHFDPITIQFNSFTNRYERGENQPKPPPKQKFSMDNFDSVELNIKLQTAFECDAQLTYSEVVESFKVIFGVGTNLVKQTVIPYIMERKLLKSLNGKYVYY